MFERTWFTIDGRLKDIQFEGDTSIRFPNELANRVIEGFTREGDWVLDPFAGFGTTLDAAQGLNRNAVGFEVNPERAQFIEGFLKEPNKLFRKNSLLMAECLNDVPRFDLVFTSPPYVSLRLAEDPYGRAYFDDMKSLFSGMKRWLKPNASIVVEITNYKARGQVNCLAWAVAALLCKIYWFKGEIIRCNTSEAPLGPGYNHSYLLCFRNRDSLPSETGMACPSFSDIRSCPGP